MKPTNEQLPEIVRRALHDHGISNEMIETCDITWDGDHVVIPIRDVSGVDRLSIALWDERDLRTLRA